MPLMGAAPPALALVCEDPNVKDLHGRAPIFEAAAGGHASTVGVLLQRGAVADLVDRDGQHTLETSGCRLPPLLESASA
eukprot:11472356-Alexandrium_andersonii.AAC.1